MASPQKENGFTPVSNELLEQLIVRVKTMRELKILLTVIRYTYGFNKKESVLSVRYISRKTGILFNHVSETISNMVANNILTCRENPQPGGGRIIALQKDYEKWKTKVYSKRNGSSLGNHEVTAMVTEVIPKEGTNKESNKDKLNKSFEKLWQSFDPTLGNKGSKQEALKAFSKLNPDESLLKKMTEVLSSQILNKRALKDRKQFYESFPHVVRWLSKKRWEDEYNCNNTDEQNVDDIEVILS